MQEEESTRKTPPRPPKNGLIPVLDKKIRNLKRYTNMHINVNKRVH